MANWFAYVAMLAWFPIALGLYARLDARLATAVVFVGAALLLPSAVAIDLPMLPPLGKSAVASISALVGCLVFARGRLLAPRRGKTEELLLLVLCIGALLTSMVNSDPVFVGPLQLPGLGLYDGFSLGASHFVYFGIPILIASRIFREPQDLLPLYRVLVVGAVFYVLPILYELRMSPQLHTLVYGFHQHIFAQAFREGGWRPLVFFPHGLSLSLFLFMSIASAAVLSRCRERILRVPAGVIMSGLFVVLIACKSVASTIYALLAVPLLLVLSPRKQLRIACVLAALILAYPTLRILGQVPLDVLDRLARSISLERAESLDFRTRNEEVLLARARERLWLGWGGWGRPRIYDPETGRDESVTDGLWIIMLGQQGLVGFFSSFGLLLAPVLLASFRSARFATKDQTLVAGLALTVALVGVDSLPNSPLPLSFLMSGALAGVAESASRRPIPLRSRAPRPRRGRSTAAAPTSPEAGDLPSLGALGRLLRGPRVGAPIPPASRRDDP